MGDRTAVGQHDGERQHHIENRDGQERLVGAVESRIDNAGCPGYIDNGDHAGQGRAVQHEDDFVAVLGQGAPEALNAAGFSDSPHLFYAGYDDKGEYFQLFQIGFGGIPGRPVGDGPDGHSLWPGFTNVPNEFIEAYFPLRIIKYEPIRDSGGAGLHRGGNGLSVAYEFLVDGEQAFRVTLVWTDFPMIEAHRIRLQMPLSDHSGVVTALLQRFGDGPLTLIKRIAVAHESVLVTVFPGLDHSSTGTTNRIRTETVFEHHTLCSKLIDIRRRVDALQPAVVRADGVRCVVITKDK